MLEELCDWFWKLIQRDFNRKVTGTMFHVVKQLWKVKEYDQTHVEYFHEGLKRGIVMHATMSKLSGHPNIGYC